MTKQIKAFVEANEIVSEQGKWADEAWDEFIEKEALTEQSTECKHDWVSAKNKFVQNGSVCLKCFAIDAKEPDVLNAEAKLKEGKAKTQEPVADYVIIDGLKYPSMVEIMTIHDDNGIQTEDNCDCINAFLPQKTKLYTILPNLETKIKELEDRLKDAEDAAWNNYKAVETITDYLIQNDWLEITVEGDGEEAGLNIINSVQKQITSLEAKLAKSKEALKSCEHTSADDLGGDDNHYYFDYELVKIALEELDK